MTEFIAGLLFAAAHAVPPERARLLSSEEWADLIDGEHELYLVALGGGG
jgi:hypothetical protein